MSKYHDAKAVNAELLEQALKIIREGTPYKVQIDNGEHFTWITISVTREPK